MAWIHAFGSNNGFYALNPISKWKAILTGILLIIFGVSFFTAGILKFQSFQRMSGQRLDQVAGFAGQKIGNESLLIFRFRMIRRRQ
jgi:uncharacterized membrane protein YphA (DoxX/SURF4 family)